MYETLENQSGLMIVASDDRILTSFPSILMSCKLHIIISAIFGSMDSSLETYMMWVGVMDSCIYTKLKFQFNILKCLSYINAL